MRVHHAGFGRELAQRLAHLREADVPFVSAMRWRDAGEEAQLHHQPDLALVVLVDVRRRGVKLLRAHADVPVDEHPLPRHLDVVEDKHGVVLVEAAGQRIVERDDRVRS